MAGNRRPLRPKSSKRPSLHEPKSPERVDDLVTLEEFAISSDIWLREQEELTQNPLSRISQIYDEEYSQTIADWVSRIESHQKAKRALEGLDLEQRRELVILILQSTWDLQAYKNHAEYRKRLTRLAQEAPRRQRNLSRKVTNARRAIEQLRDFAADLDPLIGAPVKRAAENCLVNLDSIGGHRPAEYWRQDREDIAQHEFLHPCPDDPTTFHMVQLYRFFHDQCGQSGDESEVRVALIRNAFWTDYGVRKVKYLPHYTGAESKGCTTVRQAVSRFPSDQGKTP